MTARATAWLCLAVGCVFSEARAQVNPAGAWLTLSSPHFRVHSRPEHLKTAERSAAEAERAYELLATELQPPRGAIDLVISDGQDFSNAFATVFPSNRIVVLLTPPTAEPGLQNYDAWLRLVITHELAHIFHLDRAHGSWALVQSVLGRVPGSFPNGYQPAWVTEGLASYYESRFTDGGRLEGSYHRQLLLATELGGAWLGPNETVFLFEKWPDGVAPYAFGSRFFGEVAKRSGDSAISRFVTATSGQLIPFRTGRPLWRSSRVHRDSAWRELRRSIAAEANSGAVDEAETIAAELRYPPSPAVAEDGTVAFFQARPDWAPEIVLQLPDGQTERHLSTASVDLAWSADTLYATRLDFLNPATIRADLHRLVGDRWEQLTHGARLRDLTTDSSGVVAVQLVGGTNRLVRVDRRGVTPMTEAVLGVEWASPTGSVRGSLAALRKDEEGFRLVFLGACWDLCRDSHEWVPAQSLGILADPHISSDGQTLLYVNDSSGLPQIYRASLESGPEQITFEPTGATQPALSPDGWLYFTALQADGYALKRRRWGTRQNDATIERWNSGSSGQNSNPGRTPSVPAPVVPSVRSAYQPWPALAPHYLVPFFVDKGSAGFFVGGQTSGSDPIGRTRYYAKAGLGFTGPRIAAELSIVHQRWAHASVDLYLSQRWSDAGVVPGPVSASIWVRQRDAAIGLTARWRRWRRSVSLRVDAQYEEDRFASSPALSFSSPRFVGPSVTLAGGRAVATPLGISAEDGGTASLRFRRRWRIDREGWSNEWRARATGYLALKGVGGFAHPVIAGRLSGAWSGGPDRPPFSLGGNSGAPFEVAPGVILGESRDYPVRGYSGGEIRGDQIMAAAAELRVPVALVAKPLGGLPLGLDRVSLSIFYDYGAARNAGRSISPGSLQSAGVEAVCDLGVSYEASLRVRTSLAFPLRATASTSRGRPALSLGLGADF